MPKLFIVEFSIYINKALIHAKVSTEDWENGYILWMM